MNFACIIRIKDSEQFLGSNLKEVARSEAPILRRENAESLARKRFGDTWADHVEIEEVDYSEWMSYIASKKKGKGLTEKQAQHLAQMHADLWQPRIFKLYYQDEPYYVNAKSVREGTELLNSCGIPIHRNTFWKHSKELKAPPYFMRKMKRLDYSKPMVFARNGKMKTWRKIK
jgi:hypothetical protein